MAVYEYCANGVTSVCCCRSETYALMSLTDSDTCVLSVNMMEMKEQQKRLVDTALEIHNKISMEQLGMHFWRLILQQSCRSRLWIVHVNHPLIPGLG